MTEVSSPLALISFSRYWLLQGIGLLSCIGVSVVLIRKVSVIFRGTNKAMLIIAGESILSVFCGSLLWYMLSSRPGLLWLPFALLLLL